MNHSFNIAVAMATIGAIAGVSHFEMSKEQIASIDSGALQEAEKLMEGAVVKRTVESALPELMKAIHSEGVSLAHIYANANNTSGSHQTSSSTSLKSISSDGFSSNTRADKNVTSQAAVSATCHGNHHSRGWR